MKKIITILILFGFLLPVSSFTQAIAQSEKEIHLFTAQAPQPRVQAPETVEEAKEMGEKALEIGKKELPGTIEKLWQEQVLPLWQKMWDWFKRVIWQPYIEPFFKEEIEKRKPLLEEEFEKEKEEVKEEVKEELPKAGKSLWDKFKDLIK